MTSYAFFNVKRNVAETYYGKSVTIEGVILSERFRGESYTGYDIEVNITDGKEERYSAVLLCTYDSALEPGNSFVAKVCGENIAVSQTSNYSTLSNYSDGIFIQYTSENENNVYVTDKDHFVLSVFFESINRKLSSIFSTGLDRTTAKMCSALFLGNKDGLPESVTRDFSRAGASHVLALSGMHMSIIMGLLMWIMKKIRIKHKLIAVILSFVAVFYLLLTGFQISAARSVIMLLCVYLAILSQGTPDSLTSLGFAGMLLMLLFPGSVVDAGFWMSFSATLGIIVYSSDFANYIKLVLSPYDFNKHIKKALIGLLNAIAVTLFAMIPLITVLCIFIQQISLYTILSSILLSIPTAGIILLSFLFLLFSPFSGIANVLSILLNYLTGIMVNYCAAISATSNPTVSLNYPFATIAAIVIIATIFYSFACNKSNLFITLIPYVIAVSLFIGATSIYDYLERENVKITYASSQSNMLVISNNKNVIICDMGNGSKASYFSALSHMGETRATEIRAIMLTKYSRSHLAPLYEVFNGYIVRELWLPYPENEDEYYLMAPLVDLAKDCGVDVYVFERGSSLEAFEFTSIVTENYYIERSKKPITVVNVSSRGGSLTYCDTSFNESEALPEINDYLARADYVIFGAQGPEIKKSYSLPENNSVDMVIFADQLRAAYFEEAKNQRAKRVLVDDHCTIYIKD